MSKLPHSVCSGFIFIALICANLVIAVPYGVDPSLEVDLTKAIMIDLDSLDGVQQIPGYNNLAPAFMFDGTARSVMIPDMYLTKTKEMLKTTSDFTFLATLQQDKRNSGSVICISHGHNRYLDLFVSTRNGEVRFFYNHNDEVRSEVFLIDLSESEWHKIALTVSGTQVSLYVDCDLAASLRIPKPDLSFTKSDLHIWLGQRGPTKALYKGYMQDVKIIAGNYAYVTQCPYASRTCPTCGEYLSMVQAVSILEATVMKMEQKLSQALYRIEDLEMCDCHRQCVHNGQMLESGAEWREECQTCSCTGGSVVCSPVSCPPIYCNNPIYQEGECCPVCFRNCTSSGITYHHNEIFNQKSGAICNVNVCKDGSIRRTSQNLVKNVCSIPNCPANQRFNVHGSCCQFCDGTDFCAGGSPCVEPKVCISLQTTYKCVCPGGYEELGDTCIDVDECALAVGEGINQCHTGTVCENLPGSFRCDCLSGYERMSDYQCRQIDECMDGSHQCSENALCTDIDGGHHCACQEGFAGDGTNCFAICYPPCENGGVCATPGECTCPRGFKGKQCQNDVDECERGIDDCTGYSHCMNLHGSYHCECNMGYINEGDPTGNGADCVDIDECETGHTCHKSRMCFNSEGSYICRCSAAGNCNPDCWITKKKYKRNGLEWNEDCHTCTCQTGVTTCTPVTCDCASSSVDLQCCPECVPASTCMHQTSGVIYQNRDSWRHQCQTCQCMDGAVVCSPLVCPEPNCQDTYVPVGECCPQCLLHPSCTDSKIASGANAGSKHCTMDGIEMKHNARWYLETDSCTECQCKHGQVCCCYNESCSPAL